MAYTPAPLYGPAPPGTTETTLIPAVTDATILKEILLSNTSGTDSDVTLSIRRGGAGATTANRILVAKLVPANDLVQIPLSQVLAIGDLVSGLQSVAGATNVTISGVLI